MPPKMLKKVTFVDNRAKIMEEEIPALAPDQILVKTKVSLISPGTERAALTRLWDDPGFRASPGYALAGEVIEIGSQVNEFNVGDRVITLKNHASYSVTTTEPWTTLKIPDGVSYANSTFLPLASVALHAMRRSELKLGDNFAVIGSGIIGLIAVQLANLDGARQVIAIDLVENRLALARGYGANVTINSDSEDTVERLFAETNGNGARVILEATGNTFVIPMALKLAAFGGRIVCVGVMEEKAPIALHKEFIQRELSLVAAFQPFCPVTDNIYWRWTQQENRRYLLDLMKAGKLRVDEMITHRFDAMNASDAYENINANYKEMLGALLEWE